MCKAAQDHCISCHENGGVYREPCPVLYEFKPGSYIQITHTIGETASITKAVLCHCCKNKSKFQEWLAGKRKKTRDCEVCPRFRRYHEKPLRIVDCG
jgi:hypothetical protein